MYNGPRFAAAASIDATVDTLIIVAQMSKMTLESTSVPRTIASGEGHQLISGHPRRGFGAGA